MLNSIKLLNIKITNEKTEIVLEYLLEALKNSAQKLFIVTPNPEIIVYAHAHSDYKDKLNSADVALPDGAGVFIAAGLLGHRLKERIPGIDFMETVCEKVNGKPVSIGLLGGRPGVAELTAERLLLRYPKLNIVYVSEEWSREGFFWRSKQGEKRGETKRFALSANPSAGIDILFVAYGFPKQEEWIFANLPTLPVKIAMGVGGSFDYISGAVRRAPYLLRSMGLEWLFRLIRQPWRMKRQLALGVFIWLVMKEKIFADV